MQQHLQVLGIGERGGDVRRVAREHRPGQKAVGIEIRVARIQQRLSGALVHAGIGDGATAAAAPVAHHRKMPVAVEIVVEGAAQTAAPALGMLAQCHRHVAVHHLVGRRLRERVVRRHQQCRAGITALSIAVVEVAGVVQGQRGAIAQRLAPYRVAIQCVIGICEAAHRARIQRVFRLCVVAGRHRHGRDVAFVLGQHRVGGVFQVEVETVIVVQDEAVEVCNPGFHATGTRLAAVELRGITVETRHQHHVHHLLGGQIAVQQGFLLRQHVDAADRLGGDVLDFLHAGNALAVEQHDRRRIAAVARGHRRDQAEQLLHGGGAITLHFHAPQLHFRPDRADGRPGLDCAPAGGHLDRVERVDGRRSLAAAALRGRRWRGR